ncbi:SpaA isopeptide-forming pilin-related protein [Lactococcus lactis]|uniref:SpaA isopeptide-forming pilin-related protein n=1 Tax=Lactococcus lactis TaxID=1358 RepID=UPI00071DE02B|nr:SpaA isopeptide-forming pilin-related protein [Lactococcus lactis]
MEVFLKKHMRKIVSIFFILLQFIQPITAIASTTTTDNSGIKIVSAKQNTATTVSVELSIINSSSKLRTDQIVLSDGLKATNVVQEKLLSKESGEQIGTYSLNDNILSVQTNANIKSSLGVVFELKMSQVNSNTVNTLTVNGEVTEVQALTTDTPKTSQATASSASTSDVNGSGVTTPAISSSVESTTKKGTVDSSQKKVTSTTQKALAAAGNDIGPYLPTTSNGTIITGAKLDFTDAKGNPVDPKSLSKDTNLNFDFTWAIPHNLNDGYTLQPGDYFTWKLPAGVTYQPGTGNLGDFGTYSIATDGTVTFTFNDSVENFDSISGDFHYSSKLVENTSTGDNTIIIDTTGGPIEIPITVKPTGGNDIAKSGQLVGANSSKNNPTGITWNVTINTNKEELNNASVTDPMPSDSTGKVPTTIKSITVYPLTVDMSGNVTATGEPLVLGTDYLVDATGKVTFIGAYQKTSQAFKIEYTSDIDTSKLPDDGGTLTFKNTATLNNNGKDSNAEATVTANYGKLLSKSFDGQDNNGSQKYNWHINYNYGEKNLPAGTALTDTLSAGQIFPGNPVLTYEDGNKVDPSLYSVTYNGDKTQMTITFVNGLTKGVKISYQSQVTDAIGDDGAVVNNSVSSGDKSVEAGDHKVVSQGLVKSLGNTDYNSKTVNWNFDINMARQDMTNWSMSDQVPNGLTVNYDSFVLKDKDNNKVLQKNVDYSVTPNSNGFTISFIGDLAAHAKSWYTLSYSTLYDANKLPTNGKWTNTASATWTDQSGENHTNNAKADFTPRVEAKNDGSKSGSYNAVTKEISWAVVGNYNQISLKSATIVDPILGDQDYVIGSAKLYEAIINANGSYTYGAQVQDAQISFDQTSKTINAQLPEGSSKAYILVYQTSLSGKVIDQKTYDNTATYTNDAKSSDLTAQVTVPNAGNLIEKSGKQDGSDSSYALWNIWVNKSQSTFKNAVVKDEPSGNQIIDESSIVVYPGKADAKGNFTEDTSDPLVLGKDYSVDLQTDSVTGKQTLKISFKDEINTAYSIHYRSLINSSLTNDTLTNSASVTGEGQKDVTDDTSTTTNVVNNGGSASGKNTNIVLNKVDADTQKSIVGSTFELWSDVAGKKGQKLRTATTDDSGKIIWENVKSGKYILVEVAASNGYVISPDLANGKEINIQYSDADSNNNVQVKETNQKGKITIEKADSDTSKPLAGASFDLYQKTDGDDVKVASDLVSGSDGSISYSGLGAGEYYVVETSAPAGYILDSSHHNFTINSSNIQQKVSIQNSEKTGSVILTKTDSDTHKILPGATFSLFEKGGEKIAAGLTTDDKGQITVNDLKPGEYYFQETAAPAGYTINDSKLDFTIELQTTSKVATVSAENSEKTGSVILTKTDSDTHKILPGATFSLFEKGGKEVATGLTTNDKGQITVNDLKPGEYYFQETSAPAGYALSDSKLDFTIELQTTSKVVTVSAENKQLTGSVVLTKTDGDTGEALPGAVFSLYDANGEVVKSGLTTDTNGKIKVSDLKPGEYYFQETTAPAGYELNQQKVNFVVEFQSTVKVAQVAVENMEKSGSVVLTKTDGDNGKVLSGAKFSLYKKDGTELKSNLETNAQGQIMVNDLKPGEYYFQETSAPAGYLLDSHKINFTIELQTSNKVTKVLAKNLEKVGSVILTKSDSATGKVLDGATFDLFDSKGKLVYKSLVTNSKGQIEVNNLKPGNYYFKETKAPTGYVLNDKNQYAFTIELQTTAKISKVSVTNVKEKGLLNPVKHISNSKDKGLPKTGDSSNGWIMIIGLIILISAMVVAFKFKRL